MKNARLPFSAFDILSNIIPAIIFGLGIIIIGSSSEMMVKYVRALNTIITNVNIGGRAGLSYTFLALSITATLFSLGHILMAAGSLVLDRLLIGKGIGYPYIYLLRLKKLSNWRKLSQRFYLALCAMIGFYSVILLWFPEIWLLEVFMVHISLLVGIRILVATLRNTLKKFQKAPDKTRLVGIGIFKYIIFPLAFPIYLLELMLTFIRSIFNMYPFDDEFIVNFKKLFKSSFDLDIDEVENIDSSVFWLPYTSIHENNPISSQSLQSIRGLYYFSRNLSMAFYFLLILCIVIQIMEGRNYSAVCYGSWCLLFLIVFFLHYYNIYFTFYSKQTFRAFYALNLHNMKGDKSNQAIKNMETQP